MGVIASLNQGIGKHMGIKVNRMGLIKPSREIYGRDCRSQSRHRQAQGHQGKLYGLNQGIGRHKGIKANCMDQIVWVVNDDVTGTAISIAARQSL